MFTDLHCLPASQGSVPLHYLQISSFVNSSWIRTDVTAWLGELQTHAWKNDSDTLRFLKPWSQGTFTQQQWQNLEHLYQVYRISFTRDMLEFFKMLQTDCELRAGVLGKLPKWEWSRTPAGRLTLFLLPSSNALLPQRSYSLIPYSPVYLCSLP